MDFLEFLGFFAKAFVTKVPLVAVMIGGLILFAILSYAISFKNKKLNTFSRYAPTILTTAGLLGTFVGLTLGLKAVKFEHGNLDIQSFEPLMQNLQAVFVYALSGVMSSLVFMIANTFVLRKQEAQQQHFNEGQKRDARAHNQELLQLQQQQQDYLAQLLRAQNQQQQDLQQLSHLARQNQTLAQLAELQQQQLHSQALTQASIEKLQFDHDNQELSRLISAGVVQGLSPLLLEIKTAVADQGTEAIKKVLEELKTEILLPMNGALANTNQAVRESIAAIQDAQQHNEKLIDSVGKAVITMQNASEKMHTLVDKIDKTVQHMDDIQVEQKASLTQFNDDLKTNLAAIEPAIAKGLDHAKEGLTAAIVGASALMSKSISDASQEMQSNIHTASQAMVESIQSTLGEAGIQLTTAVSQATTKLNESVTDVIEKQNTALQGAFEQFDQSQDKFKEILEAFSKEMNGHLNRMATELQEIGGTAADMIDSASSNLKNTLGDIDTKLLNTADVLEGSLETFREQYQESLTQYLDDQTENLDGFLDLQNQQLEQTIGKQREGLVTVTEDLNLAFSQMKDEQIKINQSHTQLIKVIAHTESSMLPKVESIARELSAGEQKLSRELSKSTEHLSEVTKSLAQVGTDLPQAFAQAFESLDHNYKNAFNELDDGLKDAVNNLASVVGVIDRTANGLVQAVTLHQALSPV